MMIIEQFTDDHTLNVTKEGYMFLTVKQAVQFLKTVDEDKVSEEGYLKKMIEKKRLELAKRSVSSARQNHTSSRFVSGPIEVSFNIMSNPMARDQSLVYVNS